MGIRLEMSEMNGIRSRNSKSVRIRKFSVAPSVPTLAVNGSDSTLFSPSNFHMLFDGTSISVTGSSQGGLGSGSFNITLDGNTSTVHRATSDAEHLYIYFPWYQSPSLSDVESLQLHDISITILGEYLTIDYLAIAPRMETTLLGKTLMVDDRYTGLRFLGSWETGHSTFRNPGGPSGSPDTISYSFQNTTHITSTSGSILQFTYTGTEMTLYGVFLWDKLGSFELVTKIDNQEPTTTSFSTFSNGTSDNGITQQPNFILYASPKFPAGNHNVTFTLSKCKNQTLIIDYILYTPSFNSLATMPDLTGPGSQTLSPGLPLPTSTSTTHDSHRKPKSHIAALAAGIVAGLICIALVVALVMWHGRRHARNLHYPAQSALSEQDAMEIVPFTTRRSNPAQMTLKHQTTVLTPNNHTLNSNYRAQKSELTDSPNHAQVTQQVTLHDGIHQATNAIEVVHPVVDHRVDGIDPVESVQRQIEEQERMQMQTEIRIQAMRAELHALHPPPEYQSL
ncbi:hypothetical protein DFH08DRAFT_806028 [Mycena albidolilacea]|uniref:Transmembrane protein n=1 Tax=Mycena albidolilacea TaxID=1033008 RepID=A0AAD7A7H5_9AGAR|nr:hypothetical protein DFH08DRAFT_806028 [Mycena albidolilacea]